MSSQRLPKIRLKDVPVKQREVFAHEANVGFRIRQRQAEAEDENFSGDPRIYE